jgi:hypothetical protein
MSLSKVGLAAAALAGIIGMGGGAALAGPLPVNAVLPHQSVLVQAQFYNGRRHGPPRKVCRTEVVQRWVHGRLVRDKVRRCTVIR